MSIWKSLPSWRHQMETFSVLLAICAGNSPASGEFPAQRPVTESFDVFLDLCLNKQLRKQSRGCSFERLSCPLWHHCNALDMLLQSLQLIWCCWIDRIRAVGYQINFMGSTISQILRIINTQAVNWIPHLFDRCHCSWAAVTPDIWMWFKILNMCF